MPFYEYQCQTCGHHIEVLQKISDAPITVCPACHDSSLKKLVSAAGFRLKGTGWYETDFKGNDKNVANNGQNGDSETAKPVDSAAKKKDSSKTDNTVSSKSGESKAA